MLENVSTKMPIKMSYRASPETTSDTPIALKSTDGSMDDVQLANYATINILDALKRIPYYNQVLCVKDVIDI